MNNFSSEKISRDQISKILNVIDEIAGIKNTIPLSTKSTFNFKGRKCSNIAKTVIKNLTDENSVVYDPFMGSGTFAISSASIPRKTIATELDNYTYSIVKTLISPVDFSKVDAMFSELKNDLFNDIMYLYETKCCNHQNFIKTLFFDPEPQEYYSPKEHRDIKNGKNIKLYYQCPICGSKDKLFTTLDEDKIKYCSNLNTTDFPSHKLIENSRINITSSTGADKYDTNFSNRNKYALLKIQDRINKFDESIERDVLEHALVSSLTLSRIAQYGSGSEYIYQVLRFQAQDMNVWYLFESKYKNIIAYKKELLNNKDANFTPENLILIQSDYLSLLNSNKYENLIDLIYTDPPYTDQVPYLERNQLYRDWLNKFYSSSNNSFNLTEDMLDKEMVVSNAPTRSSNKNIDKYFNDVDNMFKAFSHCLKTDGIVALTLNLGKNKYFNVLSGYINKARKNGFEYVLRVDLEKTDPSLRKQAAYSSTLSKEMLIFFIKLPNHKAYWYIDDSNIEFEITKYVYTLVANSNNGVTLSKLVQLVNSNVLNSDFHINIDVTKKVKKIIQEQFIVNPNTSKVSIDIDKLYLSIEDNTSLFGKIYNIVPPLINTLLETKQEFTLDDLYFDISSKLCNGDPNVLNQVLTDQTLDNNIKNILNNYCELKDSKYYTKKSLAISNDTNVIDISILEGYDFEELLKQLLISEGYTNVIRLGGAGDRGVDLRANKLNPLSNKIETYIFQAKRWVANVGSTPIQRLHSMKMQHSSEIDHAVCITTSDYTKEGTDVANGTGIEIVNGKDILERLEYSFPGKYCHSLLDFNI